MKLNFSVFALLLCTIFFMENPAAASEGCKPTGSDSEIIRCMAEKYQLVDAELKEKFNVIVARLPQRTNETVNWRAVKDSLQKAQSDWYLFRQKECSAWFLVNGIGRARVSDELSCLINLTSRRLDDIAKWKVYLDVALDESKLTK